MAAARRWEGLSRAQRRSIVVATVVQLSLLVAALLDLRRRPEADIRGSKRAWTAGVFVNWIGPVAYVVYGRRRTPDRAMRPT